MALAAAGVAITAAHWLDPWAYQHWSIPSVGEKDWGRMLRILGFVPTWALIAAAFWLESRVARQSQPELVVTAKAVLMAAVVGGLASELAKLLIRRERPNVAAGLYHFRGFDLQPFNTSPLGMPSGHTMTAFAGASALGRRYPRAAPLLLALAAGCGLTRIFAQAHFLSDVVAGAVGGGWIGSAIATRFGRPAAPAGPP
jgi:membrane-associated phospholipid phosphatase